MILYCFISLPQPCYLQASVADEYYCKATYTAKDEFKGGDLNSDKITVTVIGK